MHNSSEYILHCENEYGEFLYNAYYDTLDLAVADAEQFVRDLFMMYCEEKQGTQISAFSDLENLKWNFRCYDNRTKTLKEYNYSIF